ncbi:LacI family DNA-binding transcriptional regulator [Protaetiibacter sp. SSC-01]|uniref:LacI family DNA-binding transcriptional regulator n=1 Tax=Protaetiibacter sp. SSC-01 TaxID=2759943 RepID=UPI0016571431|nr:LacI family DNA-binding transcriptional regulator [Protaetiibacter sp. SSC-01]QNO36897.1 LacI family DNA-binding transcriptional regulator [Protaetiibacter sp. SSC-01]
MSYVLNDVEGRAISDATRELVLRTARELGHVPYAPARMLRLGRSDVVLALVRDFSPGYISNTLLRKLDVALAERGFVLLIHRYDESLRSVQELWQLVSPSLVVVMGGLTLSEQEGLENTASRVLRVHGTMPNARIGRLQADHLTAKGHRVLGYVLPSEPSLQLIAGERLRGLQDECAQLGIPEPVVCTVDPADMDSVTAALDVFLASEGLTAVATHNDEIGLLLVSALQARGLEAGRDLAVIGVDNIPSARLDLTTVEIDVDRWGDDVVASAIALLDDIEPEPIDHDLLHVIERRTA